MKRGTNHRTAPSQKKKKKKSLTFNWGEASRRLVAGGKLASNQGLVGIREAKPGGHKRQKKRKIRQRREHPMEKGAQGGERQKAEIVVGTRFW